MPPLYIHSGFLFRHEFNIFSCFPFGEKGTCVFHIKEEISFTSHRESRDVCFGCVIRHSCLLLPSALYNTENIDTCIKNIKQNKNTQKNTTEQMSRASVFHYCLTR